MAFATRHPIIILASVTMLIGQIGCTQRPPTSALRPSEEVRAQLGTIGVVSGRFSPEADMGGNLSGPGEGAATYFFDTIQAGSEAGAGPRGEGVIFLALGVVIAPAAALVGAVVGAVEEADAESALKNALAGLKVQETIRDRLLEVARDKTAHTFVVLTDQGPTSPYEKVDYRSLRGKGVETILEVSVPKLGFIHEILLMTTVVRLIRVQDGKELYALTSECDESCSYTEGMAAQSRRDTLESALQASAEQIVDELFLRPSSPQESATGEGAAAAQDQDPDHWGTSRDPALDPD